MALIFDSGPSEYTLALSAALVGLGVKASFFVNADKLGDQSNRQIIRKLHKSGHTIGISALNIPPESTLSRRQMKTEIERCGSLINKAVGHRSKFFLPSNLLYDKLTKSVVKKLDLIPVLAGYTFNTNCSKSEQEELCKFNSVLG